MSGFCGGGNDLSTNTITPALGVLVISLLTAGVTMSTYLPLMPTIFWIMAVGGWFVVVIEAMIAAPLWAVMHASPEGHEWSGKGAQGYQLVLGVILRPALMLFGLIGAMLLFRVMCVFALMMMGLASENLGDAVSDGSAGNGFFGVLVIMFINIWLLQKIFAKLLEMIGSVPSSIMRWIGGGIDPFHDNTAEAGKGFAQQVVGRGESAAQAAMGASKNNRANKLSSDRHKDTMEGQAAHTDAIKANTAKMDQVMGGSSNGGKGSDGGGSGGGSSSSKD